MVNNFASLFTRYFYNWQYEALTKRDKFHKTARVWLFYVQRQTFAFGFVDGS